ncbi:sigma-70 family RNA polymerase sigma factor [Nocardia sp. NBC_01388]|uniref:sigma-70 family RNA polymerase sigma factor n=1 Tax=Nocardia sp. NBC_01388 TaxID=2903596 RepID=UPI00324CDEEE
MNTDIEDRSRDEDFARSAEPLRRELIGYCYRMLGSLHDAEEVVQQVYLDAWRSYDRFEGRSSLRTWMYRIATRASLRALERARYRPRPSGLGPPGTDAGAGDSEVRWLEPFPDRLIMSDPASVVITRQTTRLALVAALQKLPARQRAVLILRDVLDWHATEVAVALEMTVAAVNSALQRARAQMPVTEEGLTEPIQARQRELLDRYAAAFENADVRGLVAALTDDVTWEMPPDPLWFADRATTMAFLGSRMEELGSALVQPISANGQPALALYIRDTTGDWCAHAIHVLTVVPEGISRVAAFLDPALFPAFGLPDRLHPDSRGMTNGSVPALSVEDAAEQSHS